MLCTAFADSDFLSSSLSELQQLKVLLQPQNKTVVNVDSDGNCLFSALALQLQCGDGLVISHYDVRQNLVKYLRDHPEMVCTCI